MEIKITQAAKDYRAKMFASAPSTLAETDPEFAAVYENFAFDKVPNSSDLDDHSRFVSVLAALIGCQSVTVFPLLATAALEFGLKPIEIREIVYQSVAYQGSGRMLKFIPLMNDVFRQHGIELPLEGTATVAHEDRRRAGNELQVEIFGEGMRESYNQGDDETRHINEWLSSNCFGDWYTREGLNLADRELVTFCLLVAQGGCEAQVTAHAKGNMNLGNDREYLIKVVSQLVPYLGFPRCLNAISCINKAAEQE